MKRLYLFAAMCSSSTSANADSSICDAVLSKKTFNTYNAVYQSSIYNTVANLICTVHISSQKELSNQQSSLQAGGQYEMVSGYFNSAQASGSSSYEDTYDKTCNKHDQTFINNVFSSQQSQITDRNVDAWEKCIEHREGLFSALKNSADNKTFTITISYIKPRISPTKLVLKGIDDKYGFSCTLDGSSIANFVPEDHGYLAKFGVTCVRSSEMTNNTLLINTNIDTVGPFDVPSKAFLDLSAKVDSLQNQANVITTRVSQGEGTTGQNTQNIGVVTSRLNAASLECVDVTANGADASCQSGWLATGCTAGKNYASHSIQNKVTCHTHSLAADWTTAHCCRVKIP
jgi:hypothetical protein